MPFDHALAAVNKAFSAKALPWDVRELAEQIVMARGMHGECEDVACLQA